MPSFKAYRISANHNLLFPDCLDVETDRIVYYKGALIGYQKAVILRKHIASVRIRSNVIFADIIIESYGGRKLELNGFSKSDAKIICNLLSS